MAEADVLSHKMKHIEVRHHFIRDIVLDQHIYPTYCPTTEMVADLLTKSLPRSRFEYLRNMLGMTYV